MACGFECVLFCQCEVGLEEGLEAFFAVGIKLPAFFKASNDSGVSFTYIPDCCAICVILFAASVPKCNQRLNLSRGILRAHFESPYCAENSWIAIFVAENERTIPIRNDFNFSTHFLLPLYVPH